MWWDFFKLFYYSCPGRTPADTSKLAGPFITQPPSCKYRHPKQLDGVDLKELAQKLGNLTYDSLGHFLYHLAVDIERQGSGDALRGREKLASELFSAGEALHKARVDIEKAWDICEPFMKDDIGSK